MSLQDAHGGRQRACVSVTSVCVTRQPPALLLVHFTVCKQEAGRLFSAGIFSSPCPLVASLPLPPSLLCIMKLTLPPGWCHVSVSLQVKLDLGVGGFRELEPTATLPIFSSLYSYNSCFPSFVFPWNLSESVVCTQVRLWLSSLSRLGEGSAVFPSLLETQGVLRRRGVDRSAGRMWAGSVSGAEMAFCLLLNAEMSSLDSLCSSICYKQSRVTWVNSWKPHTHTPTEVYSRRSQGVEKRSPAFWDGFCTISFTARLQKEWTDEVLMLSHGWLPTMCSCWALGITKSWCDCLLALLSPYFSLNCPD